MARVTTDKLVSMCLSVLVAINGQYYACFLQISFFDVLAFFEQYGAYLSHGQARKSYPSIEYGPLIFLEFTLSSPLSTIPRRRLKLVFAGMR